jgi:DHA1 family arabinose polymer transporter-like MFS transporter
MVFGNFVGARMAEFFAPMKAVIISLLLMVSLLLINMVVAVDPTAILVLTFLIGIAAFSVATPIQMAIIKASRGSEMLGSSMNQSAFNMGNATGAYLAGLPIAMGYGFTSAGLVGAVLAATGVVIAIGIVVLGRERRSRVRRRIAFNLR